MTNRATFGRKQPGGKAAGPCAPRLAPARDAEEHAFTLPELFVAIGIIVVLIAILLPVVTRARREAKRVQCLANLHALGHALLTYAGENQGWLYPVDRFADGKPRVFFGVQVAPHERWPAIVFKLRPSDGGPPLPYDPATYTQTPYDPVTFPAAPYTPALLRCPADVEESAEAHSYALNGHLASRGFRLGAKDLGGRTPEAVILAGEKIWDERDYHIDNLDFARVAEPFHHGKTVGSNYLFIDGHAETQLPRTIGRGMDPWDVTR